MERSGRLNMERFPLELLTLTLVRRKENKIKCVLFDWLIREMKLEQEKQVNGNCREE